MQNKNNIEKDVFGEMMCNRLENAQTPVDEGLWAEIEQRMHKKRRVVPFWLWTTIGGVAAIALILLTLRPFSGFVPENNQVSETASQHKVVQPAVINISPKQSEISYSQNKPTVSIPNKIDKSVKIKTVISSNKHVVVIKKTITNVEVENTSPDDKNKTGRLYTKITNEADLAINSKSENDIETIVTEDKSEKIEVLAEKTKIKKYDQLNDYQTDNNKVYVAPKRDLEKPMLAASFGTGDGAEFGSLNSFDEAPVYESLVNAETQYSKIMAAADFTTTTYLPPVSFGLKISKEFAEKLSIESGLVYTYMSSLYKDAIFQNVKADLNLHYLGIPVNLICNIAHNKKWDIYLSGGGMIEKGLRSVYHQRTLVGSYEYTTVAKTKIEGIQMSINGATGFSYLIYNDIAFYAEPSITFYFKNNQPMSARTDEPLVVGFNAGLRFKL